MAISKLGFIGLGLIGGSIVKTVKRIYPSIGILALSGHESTIKAAYEEGLIENQYLPQIHEFSDCDYIFLCTPVKQNLMYLKKLKPYLKDTCILTDVGSVKGEIYQEVEQLGLEKYFIGGHPMTGSEKTGLKSATPYLLENAFYILTPGCSVKEHAVAEFRDFVASMGAIPLILDVKEHDFATAAISHVPHIIAAALVNLVRRKDTGKETMKTIAAGGFKDITRIASSSPVMWEEICMSNKEQILSLLDAYMESLTAVRETISSADHGGIYSFFEAAKDYRDSLTISSGDALKTVFEFYCDLIDEAGGIATIATILATNHLSIKNIGIIHNREFEEGVLKIEMYDAPSYQSAIQLLNRHHYTIYER